MKIITILFCLLVLGCFAHGSNADLVATCLIREAGGKGECMASVMHVISNRAKVNSVDSYVKVITKPWQFESIHNQNHAAIIAKAKRHPRWNEAQSLVNQALSNELPWTAAKSATHFFNPKLVMPKWAAKMKFVARIGGHDFYKGK
jgi:spore germination cell wall hydrolase CwlJ-like protein